MGLHSLGLGSLPRRGRGSFPLKEEHLLSPSPRPPAPLQESGLQGGESPARGEGWRGSEGLRRGSAAPLRGAPRAGSDQAEGGRAALRLTPPPPGTAGSLFLGSLEAPRPQAHRRILGRLGIYLGLINVCTQSYAVFFQTKILF